MQQSYEKDLVVKIPAGLLFLRIMDSAVYEEVSREKQANKIGVR
jgi:hypothetical protein